MKRVLKILLRVVLAVVLFVGLYILAAFTLAYIPYNVHAVPCNEDCREIYILSNGVHTDLVLPLRNDMKDWSAFVNPVNTRSGDTAVRWVAFGWGDKGFYLETPTWADLKVSTAFKALFYLGTSAMHVTFYKKLEEGEHCKRIKVNRQNYARLVTYIQKSFALEQQKPVLLPGKYYADGDSFYDAKGTYNLFFTCNTWANNGLKAASLRASWWTPFDQGIFQQYK
jgi:uncharacterized protein (TIGR02117 family)